MPSFNTELFIYRTGTQNKRFYASASINRNCKSERDGESKECAAVHLCVKMAIEIVKFMATYLTAFPFNYDRNVLNQICENNLKNASTMQLIFNLDYPPKKTEIVVDRLKHFTTFLSSQDIALSRSTLSLCLCVLIRPPLCFIFC